MVVRLTGTCTPHYFTTGNILLRVSAAVLLHRHHLQRQNPGPLVWYVRTCVRTYRSCVNGACNNLSLRQHCLLCVLSLIHI